MTVFDAGRHGVNTSTQFWGEKFGSSCHSHGEAIQRHSEKCKASYTPVLIALFVISKYWNQPKCPLMGEWMNCGTPTLWNTTQQWKRNELLIHTTTWMNLRCSMLCERSQSQKNTYCIIPFLWHSWNNINIEMENRLVVVTGRGGEEERWERSGSAYKKAA